MGGFGLLVYITSFFKEATAQGWVVVCVVHTRDISSLLLSQVLPILAVLGST